MDTTTLIEKEVADYKKRHPETPTHNLSVLRDMLQNEHKYWEREARDYVYGQDEGEPPRGAKW